MTFLDTDVDQFLERLREKDDRARAALAILEQTGHLGIGCQWPMVRYRLTGGGDFVLTCGQACNSDRTPRFCWQHTDMMLSHVESSIRDGHIPARTFEDFADAVFDRLRQQADEPNARYRIWNDWIEAELERRLREGELSKELQRALVGHVEQQLSERWEF